eukprot:265306-Rhodomonas_salina.2
MCIRDRRELSAYALATSSPEGESAVFGYCVPPMLLRPTPLSPYASATQCPVLTYAREITLRARYSMSGTDTRARRY